MNEQSGTFQEFIKTNAISAVKRLFEPFSWPKLIWLKFKSGIARMDSKYQVLEVVNIFMDDLDPETTSSRLKKVSDLAPSLIELRQLGVKVFDGDTASFKSWLSTRVPALEARPIDLLSSSVGIEKVRTQLLQMEFGVD
jgi:hypothetical protein